MSQGAILTYWDPKFGPAEWAFSIWGVIYGLISIFVVYQALPDSLVPDRNNDLIFTDINFWFFVN